MKYTSNLLVGSGLSAVLPLGDDQYNCGTLSAFDASYDPTWGRVKSITHPAVGNHEYLTTLGAGCAGSAEAVGYFDYFDGPGNQTGPAGARGQGYYSFDVGSWHLIALNSNCSYVDGCDSGCSPGERCHQASPQETWLRADLAAHPNRCTLAYWHAPRFSSGKHGDDLRMRAIWEDLYAAGAEVVLNGHDHDYERFAAQTPTGGLDPAGGIREFVVGTGGRGLRPISSLQPNSERFNSNTYGVLKLTLHPDGYDWQFAPGGAGGGFTDSGSGTCH
jgi:hypothetical protein